MKKSKLYQISLLLVTPQTTATTPNGCPKPLPTPTIRQLRTLDTGTQPHQCQGRKQTGRFVSQDVIGLVGGENFYQFSPNTQSWIDSLGLKELYYLVARKDGFYPVMEG